MPTLAVILDTNAYIGLNERRMDVVLAREREHGILAIAAHHTMFELITGSLDPDGRKAGRSVAGLKRLYRHCREYSGSQSVLRCVAYSDAQAAHDLFGRHSSEYEQDNLLGSLAHWQFTREDPTWGTSRPLVESLLSRRDAQERAFSETLFRNVVQRLAPSAGTWVDVTSPSPLRSAILAKADNGEGIPLLGRSVVIRAARHVGISLPDDEIERLAAKARAQYPVPIALLDSIIRSIIADGHDMSRPERANSLWDYEICFCIGRGTTLAGVPARLITTDNEILHAANRVNALNVQSLSEYEALIARSHEDFLAHLEGRPPHSI